jgi:DNA-directed RNA polymerase specialized sigma24 family protein
MTATDLEPPDKEGRSLPLGRLPEVQEQIDALSALDHEQLLARLCQAALQRDLRPEVLLQFARHDLGAGGQAIRLAAFEALVRVATPMLFSRMSRLYRMSEDDIQDHQNLVFEDLFRRVVEKDPGLEYGVRRFASFLLRRSEDAMKSRHHPWAPSIRQVSDEITRYFGGEGAPNFDAEGELIAPSAAPTVESEAFDPETRAHGQQELAAAKKRVAHLPEKAFKAFLMSRVLGRTQDQIALRFGVTARTVREWIGNVAEVLDERKEQ